MSKMEESEIARKMSAVPDWERAGEAIARTVRFETFADGIEFVRRVAPVADEMDHHPDIDIRYRNITFSLTSHDTGGLTSRDFTLAAKIDEMLAG